MHIASIGVDLGKTTFHLVALGAQGKVVVRKKFSRKQLLAYTANLQSSLVGIEACSGAHFIGAALRSQGHDVRLIPAQFVKFYVKSNKNDFPRCGSRRRSGGAAAGREATCELRILWQVRCVRSHERASGDLCFPLTKTYMDVGNPEAIQNGLGGDQFAISSKRTSGQHR